MAMLKPGGHETGAYSEEVTFTPPAGGKPSTDGGDIAANHRGGG